MKIRDMILVALLGGATVTSAFAQATPFTLDKGHANLGFEVSHLGLADTVGRFNNFDGTFLIDEKAPEKSRITFTVKTASIDTNHKERDEHLRSAAFLNSAKFPEMTFVSTGVTMLTQTQGKLHGNLTLLGVTKPVTLDFKLQKDGKYPGFIPNYDEIRAVGFEATGSILRVDYGMNFAPIAGGPVGLEVKINAKFDLVDCAGAAATNIPCHWGR